MEPHSQKKTAIIGVSVLLCGTLALCTTMLFENREGRAPSEAAPEAAPEAALPGMQAQLESNGPIIESHREQGTQTEETGESSGPSAGETKKKGFFRSMPGKLKSVGSKATNAVKSFGSKTKNMFGNAGSKIKGGFSTLRSKIGKKNLAKEQS